MHIPRTTDRLRQRAASVQWTTSYQRIECFDVWMLQSAGAIGSRLHEPHWNSKRATVNLDLFYSEPEHIERYMLQIDNWILPHKFWRQLTLFFRLSMRLSSEVFKNHVFRSLQNYLRVFRCPLRNSQKYHNVNSLINPHQTELPRELRSHGQNISHVPTRKSTVNNESNTALLKMPVRRNV